MFNGKIILFAAPVLAAIAVMAIILIGAGFSPRELRATIAEAVILAGSPAQLASNNFDQSSQTMAPSFNAPNPQSINDSGVSMAVAIQQMENDFGFYTIFAVILALGIAFLIIGFIWRLIALRFKK